MIAPRRGRFTHLDGLDRCFRVTASASAVEGQTIASDEPRASRQALARLLLSPWESSRVGSVGSGYRDSSGPAAGAACVDTLAIRRKAVATGGQDTCRAMAGESTTSDATEIALRMLDAANRGDLDAWADSFARDAVFLTGVGRFEGRDAIRGYAEEFWSSYDELSATSPEVHDLGNGVAWGTSVYTARLRGSSAEVRLPYAGVFAHEGGLVTRWTDYFDIDEARAAAERLAQERG